MIIGNGKEGRMDGCDCRPELSWALTDVYLLFANYNCRAFGVLGGGRGGGGGGGGSRRGGGCNGRKANVNLAERTTSYLLKLLGRRTDENGKNVVLFGMFTPNYLP